MAMGNSPSSLMSFIDFPSYKQPDHATISAHPRVAGQEKAAHPSHPVVVPWFQGPLDHGQPESTNPHRVYP